MTVSIHSVRKFVLFDVAIGFIGSLLFTLASQCQLPMYPVPITLQTFAITLLGCYFTRRQSLFCISGICLEAFYNLPVFATAPSAFWLLSPRAGYIIAMFVSMWLLSSKINEKSSSIRIFTLSLLSNIFILIFGAIWLSLASTFYIGYYFGFEPFILGELLKAIIAVVIIYFAKKV